MNERIAAFRDEHYFLSNFFPVSIPMDGVTYGSSENAYQAAKTLSMTEREKFTRISAGEAKRLGRAVTLRPDWDDVKIPIMRMILWLKFSHPTMREKLLSTGDAHLIEGNTWGDKFWGSTYDVGIGDYVGKNILGNLLMEIRAHYQLLQATEE